MTMVRSNSSGEGPAGFPTIPVDNYVKNLGVSPGRRGNPLSCGVCLIPGHPLLSVVGTGFGLCRWSRQYASRLL